MTTKEKKLYEQYFHDCLFQFLGIERDIYVNERGSFSIYDWKHGKLNIFPKANKIYQPKNSKWIYDAEFFIRKNIIRDTSCPSFDEYHHRTLF